MLHPTSFLASFGDLLPSGWSSMGSVRDTVWPFNALLKTVNQMWMQRHSNVITAESWHLRAAFIPQTAKVIILNCIFNAFFCSHLSVPIFCSHHQPMMLTSTSHDHAGPFFFTHLCEPYTYPTKHMWMWSCALPHTCTSSLWYIVLVTQWRAEPCLGI